MRKSLFFCVLAAALSTAALAADADRYVAPGGVFSIAANDAAAPRFRIGKESKSHDLTVSDFPFLSSSGLPLVSSRTVEWLKIDKPIDPLQMDAEASSLVAGYLESRYGAGVFTVGGSGKFRTASGQLIYVFAALGTLDTQPARWQGVMRFFDGGVALIAEAVPLAGGPAPDISRGIVSQAAIDWAETLRPGA